MKTIINTNFGKILAIAMISMVTFSASAQEEEETSKFSLSGSVDAYYRTTFHDAGDATTASYTSFANQTGFALGMANLVGTYDMGDTGVVVDLVFGPRGTEATFENDVLNGIINQAYVYWNVSEGTTLTMGRFNTFLGYEVIAPQANFNYSVSYLFSNGPFSHLSGSGEYSLGGQLGAYGQFLNLYYDSGKSGGLGFEIDYTGGFDVTEDFFFGINAAYNDNSETGTGFYGAAIYPQLTTSENFAIGLRGEYMTFTDDAFDDDSPVLGLTLTGSFTKDNLIIKPEVRLDTWGNDVEPYLDSDGAFTSNQSSILIAAIYSF